LDSDIHWSLKFKFNFPQSYFELQTFPIALKVFILVLRHKITFLYLHITGSFLVNTQVFFSRIRCFEKHDIIENRLFFLKLDKHKIENTPDVSVELFGAGIRND